MSGPAWRASKVLWILLVAGFTALPGRAVSAQQPSAEQARQLLRSRPDLVTQLRQRIGASGLTPDQIRARLRAAGYPETLLDDYLSGADSTRTVTPNSNVIEAVRLLG
ncbi:MAG: hypothetical protein ABI836_15250, partial [Gemmatimonadota bacterium]